MSPGWSTAALLPNHPRSSFWMSWASQGLFEMDCILFGHCPDNDSLALASIVLLTGSVMHSLQKSPNPLGVKHQNCKLRPGHFWRNCSRRTAHCAEACRQQDLTPICYSKYSLLSKEQQTLCNHLVCNVHIMKSDVTKYSLTCGQHYWLCLNISLLPDCIKRPIKVYEKMTNDHLEM